MNRISYSDFERVDVRVGEIVEAKEFAEAKNPSYRLKVDFGNVLGIKNSSAHITNYKKEELVGKQVIAVVNFPPKQIANFISEVLVLGVTDKDGTIRLLAPDKKVEAGVRMF